MSAEQMVVAVAGASGSIYARRLLAELIATRAIEVAVVFSRNARQIWRHELGVEPECPFRIYDDRDFTAPFASGSSRFAKMIIVPCSTGTLARIATGATDNLITRAAEVMLKERRKLVCVLRETPYNLIHIENMRTVTMAGGIICPATPSFYSQPKTVDEVVDTVVSRALDLAGIPCAAKRWGDYETRIKVDLPA
jgi:4-hydroxy-3-polyprenylbenzoate decarboxylase